METVGSLIIFIIIGLFITGIYFIPSFIAYRRKHKQTISIILLNFFLGWSLIGWVGALIWACAN